MKLHNGDCLTILKTLESDSLKGGRDQWINWLQEVMTEVLRVLKPGAHGLVWALPRTSHWTAFACEKAGFEVRDCITHIQGQGFPKSLNVSKAIDKMAGAEREVGGASLEQKESVYNFTTPATPEAKQWDGWGTALKPASEHWWLVRKPLSEKTIAKNVLKHGTGGLNIDASRIDGLPRSTHADGNFRTKSENVFHGANPLPLGQYPVASGRFPSNTLFSHHPECEVGCHPDCAVAELDRQSGHLHGAGNKRDKSKPSAGGYNGNITGEKNPNYYKDAGGASRFFYCAKASKYDKGADNTHPTVKNTKIMEYLITMITPPGGIVLDPFMGSGSTGVAAKRRGFSFVGIEMEAEYFAIAEARIIKVIK